MNSRREFLKSLAVAGAGAMLPANAQDSARSPGRIDVHHHMQPPFYVNAMADELKRSNFNVRPWTPAVSLDAMDKHGIATSMLSPVQRLVSDSMSDRSERARNLVRQNNEFGAQVVRDHPGRFGLLRPCLCPIRTAA